MQEYSGSFSFNWAAVFGNALRKLPGALANLLVNSRESKFVACPWRDCRYCQGGFALSIMHRFFNKNWPVGALVLKEWELEVRGTVTAAPRPDTRCPRW